MSFTTLPNLLAGDEILSTDIDTIFAAIAELRPLFARKTANEIVNNSATLQDDNELLIPVEANVTYVVDLILAYTSAAAADIKFGLTYPTGTTGTWSGVAYDAASAFVNFANVSIATAVILGGTATDREARLTAVVAVSSTAGTLRLQFAQGTANVSDTTVYAGSIMVGKKSA